MMRSERCEQMKNVLIVLDMQEIAFGKDRAPFFRYDADLLQSVNAVIDAHIPDDVIYIRTVMKKGLLSRFAPVQVYDGTPQAALAAELHKVSDHEFIKYRGDAFTEQAFAAYMKACGADTAAFAGIDGGGCVALTALTACRNGLHVIIHTGAVGTMFPAKQEKHFAKLKQLGAEFL